MRLHIGGGNAIMAAPAEGVKLGVVHVLRYMGRPFGQKNRLGPVDIVAVLT